MVNKEAKSPHFEKFTDKEARACPNMWRES